LLQSDTWVAPHVSGPPSPGNFCTFLVAIYEHEAQLPLAATTKVKEEIVEDYVDTVPKALAEAPADIAGPAQTYLRSVAELLTYLVQAGFNPQKVRGSDLAAILLDPSVKSAGNQVLAYSSEYCHYDIGS
jgi:hypothetical protein